MHFPDIENKSHLSLFNASNMIVLHFLRKERLSFHDRCVFPYINRRMIPAFTPSFGRFRRFRIAFP